MRPSIIGSVRCPDKLRRFAPDRTLPVGSPHLILLVVGIAEYRIPAQPDCQDPNHLGSTQIHGPLRQILRLNGIHARHDGHAAEA